MEHKKAMIIANGKPPAMDTIRPYLKQADTIIAADGGSLICKKLGITPAVILGDFDSIDDDLRKHFATSQFLHRSDQNYTDIQKALNYCRQQDIRSVTLFAVFGLRNDHASGNLIIFESFDPDIELTAVDEYGVMSRLFPGQTALPFSPGTTVSLFSLRPVINLSLEGFEYPLTGQSFAPFFLGISNVIQSSGATVSFDQGRLLLYRLVNHSGENPSS